MSEEQTEKKLFLLDAFALIYRAYFAFSSNPRVNSKGMNTSAVFGFTNTLLEILKKENPSHIAVVFDTAEPTQRHVEFEDYKANRDEMPEDLAESLPYIFKLVEGFNIPVISKDGYEADDIIGTLAKKAEEKGFITYMMTPDKDYGQLVSENIFIYKPARMGNGAEVMGVKQVCEKWDIKNVNELIDILGLMGDSVDNIPGIPGVGEKTAVKLIKEFGSVENLVNNTDKLKGKLKERVENNKEQALLSKKLATIICDVPVEFNEKELRKEEVNKEALKEIFVELEFRRLAQSILGETIETEIADNQTANSKSNKGQIDLFWQTSGDSVGTDAAVAEVEAPVVFESIESTSHKYQLIETKEQREQLIEKLVEADEICFDTETTGLNTRTAELVGLSFAIKEHEAYYVPAPNAHEEIVTFLAEFKKVFEDQKKLFVAQNIKYDLSVLTKYGVHIKGKMFDTMIAHFLIRPDMRHNMDVLAESYLNYTPVSIETLIGKKGKHQKSMRDVPLEILKDYAAEDADITLQLKNKFEPLLKENNATTLFNQVEMPLVPVLADMEHEGIKLDLPALKTLSDSLAEDILRLEKEIHEIAGGDFNIASPKQVGEVLFDRLKIVDKPKKTKTGQYATSEDILIKLESKHEIVKKILEYRELQKLKNTYVDSLPNLIDQNSGKIHTTFNQVVAVTGRLSSDNPNLQNIPIRTERGREVRKAFIPRDNEHTLLAADYSQIELRIIAELSNDEGMIEAFEKDLDIHAATAAKVYNVALEEVTSDMRRNAKMVNFGIIYGISAFGLAERLNISRTEAKEIIEQYFEKYPRVKAYMDESIEVAREQGYVETIMGRRRYLKDINSRNAAVRGYAERNAINAPIQGSAADIIKVAMINVHSELKINKFESKLLLQVHDELVFDASNDELERLKPLVKTNMENAYKMRVPLRVDMGAGSNWLKAH